MLIPDSTTSIFGKPVDIVVFGYTMRRWWKLAKGCFWSILEVAAWRTELTRLGTVAILEATPESRTAWIVDLAALDA